MIEVTDYEAILKIVASWPPPRRFALLQDVLRSLATEAETDAPKRPTLAIARGLLATDRTPPSDAEVDQWRGE